MKKQIIYFLLFISVVGLTFWWLVKIEQIKKQNSSNSHSIVNIDNKVIKDVDKGTSKVDTKIKELWNQIKDYNGNDNKNSFTKTWEIVKPELNSGSTINEFSDEWKDINKESSLKDTKKSSFPKAGEIVKLELQNNEMDNENITEEKEDELGINWENQENISWWKQSDSEIWYNDIKNNEDKNVDNNKNNSWTNENFSYDELRSWELLWTKL